MSQEPTASHPPIRIGIDATPLAGPIAGIGRYTAEICLRLDALLPEAEFLLYTPLAIDMALPSARWSIRLVRRRVPGSYFWLKSSLRKVVAHDCLDVFWATRTLLPSIDPGPRTLSTVYDLNYRLVPESMPPMTRLAHRLWFRHDLKRADAIIAASRGTASRLREHLGIDAHAIASPGVGSAFVAPDAQSIQARLASLGVSRPFFLGVGTLEPRKNLVSLIEAFTALRARRELDEYSLILVGKAGWGDRKLRASLRSAASTRVHWIGRAPDEDLAALYASCAAFVFPSHYEGFGIPAAEALACRARVIASDLPELRESTSGCAHFITPDRDGVARALLAAAQGRIDWPDIVAPATWDDAAHTMARTVRHLSGHPVPDAR